MPRITLNNAELGNLSINKLSFRKNFQQINVFLLVTDLLACSTSRSLTIFREYRNYKCIENWTYNLTAQDKVVIASFIGLSKALDTVLLFLF